MSIGKEVTTDSMGCEVNDGPAGGPDDKPFQEGSTAADAVLPDVDEAEIIFDPEIVDVAESEGPKHIAGKYRKAELSLPVEIQGCPGISLFGRIIRSFVFSTDLAIIRNCDADAVLAVYPFTCQPSITQALLNIAERPVFAGVAGSLTTGMRSVELAMQSEMQGATGVVVNAAVRPDVITNIARSVDIPVVLTIGAFTEYSAEQIDSGAQIVNVSAGKQTVEVVRALRERYPEIPIIASGGGTGASVSSTIAAGADAISWTPPSMVELERDNMAKNRAVQAGDAQAHLEGRAVRDAEVLEAAARAATKVHGVVAQVRQELAAEGAREWDGLFSGRLDESEKLLFRQLLTKLFAVPSPEGEDACAQRAGGEDDESASASSVDA